MHKCSCQHWLRKFGGYEDYFLVLVLLMWSFITKHCSLSSGITVDLKYDFHGGVLVNCECQPDAN